MRWNRDVPTAAVPRSLFAVICVILGFGVLAMPHDDNEIVKLLGGNPTELHWRLWTGLAHLVVGLGWFGLAFYQIWRWLRERLEF